MAWRRRTAPARRPPSSSSSMSLLRAHARARRAICPSAPLHARALSARGGAHLPVCVLVSRMRRMRRISAASLRRAPRSLGDEPPRSRGGAAGDTGHQPRAPPPARARVAGWPSSIYMYSYISISIYSSLYFFFILLYSYIYIYSIYMLYNICYSYYIYTPIYILLYTIYILLYILLLYSYILLLLYP